MKKKTQEQDDDDYDNDGEELLLEKKFAEEYLRNKDCLEKESVQYRLKSNSEK